MSGFFLDTLTLKLSGVLRLSFPLQRDTEQTEGAPSVPPPRHDDEKEFPRMLFSASVCSIALQLHSSIVHPGGLESCIR